MIYPMSENERRVAMLQAFGEERKQNREDDFERTVECFGLAFSCDERGQEDFGDEL